MEEQKKPAWITYAKIIGSIFVVIHFTALAVNAMAGGNQFRLNSPDPEIEPFIDTLDPPLFASKLKPTVNPYLQLVRMTSDQRFSNQIIEKFVCKLEVKLRDQGGKELQTIQFPSPDASQSVQLRQSMLAQKLWRIERIEQSGTLVPTRENKKMLPYWRDVDGQNMVLDEIAQHLTLGKDLDRPSDSAITLARSYGSYFATQQQAKSAEVVRHMRRTTWPIALMADLDALRSYLGDTKICSFGVVNADQ